jgi:hypothetical protein
MLNEETASLGLPRLNNVLAAITLLTIIAKRLAIGIQESRGIVRTKDIVESHG